MIPPDKELQKMSDEQLAKLWNSKPACSTNHEWVRVAKELRHRTIFKKENK